MGQDDDGLIRQLYNEFKQVVTMNKTDISRQDIEDFLYEEADCLDRWALDEWLALWSDSGDLNYQVAPTGEEDLGTLEPGSTMFLVADDRYRLQQRIIRMNKSSFHSEYIKSRTRHMYGHVRIIRQEDKAADITFNSTVYRTRDDQTVVYPSMVRATVSSTDEGLRLVKKRVELDLQCLATMGALTIIL
jgi:p-cumate 2,3-dioxygenase subunit beta